MDPEALKESPSSLRPNATTQLLSLLSHLRRLLAKTLTLFLLIFPRSLKPASTKPPHPTAYLDALRGYAAWVVYNMHFIPKDWRTETSSTLLGPAINIWFQGRAMVDLFFVISGFALSYSVLGHIHHGRTQRVLESLASSVLRRHARLYLPLTWASFVAMLCISTGVAVKPTKPVVLQDTFLENFTFWIKDTVRSCNPFPHVVSFWFKGVRATHTDYLPQAWTIPVEFRGSLIVFLFCLAVSRMRSGVRSWVILGGVAACYWWVTAYGGLFLWGMWLADRRQRANVVGREGLLGDEGGRARLVEGRFEAGEESAREGLLEDEEKQGGENDDDDETHFRYARNWVSIRWSQLWQKCSPAASSSSPPTLMQQLPYIALFTFSLYPLCAPVSIDSSSPFPYNFLSYTMPPSWINNQGSFHWPYCLGAMLLCYSLEHSPLLQKPLTLPFSQFLGELSFGIYVMHNLVRWSVWERYLVEWGRTYGGEEPRWQVPGYLVVTVLVFWAAEGFRRVDGWCVRLTRRLEGWVVEK